MLCRSCKTVLSDGETRCPVCGVSIMIDGLQSPYELDNEVIPFIDYSQPRSLPVATSIQISHAESSPKQPYASQQTILANPQSDVQQPLQIRHGISAGAAAMLIVLAFLLIGGSGFSYYMLKVQPAELSVQATDVVRNILTVQVQSTSNANARAFASFTAIPPQEMYHQIVSQKPTFTDQMDKQDSHSWAKYMQPTGACTFLGGAYHVRTSLGFPLCLALNTDLSNFAYQAHMTLLHGDGGTLLFRVDYLHYTFYRFIIHSDGTYSLNVLHNNGPYETILDSGYSSVIDTNMNPQPASIIATVIAFDNLIYLYVNGQFLSSVKDSTNGSGKIGVSATTNNNPTEVVFSDIQVWEL